MSWLFKSPGDDPEPSSPSGGGGVKDDLSSIGLTISRQLRGVAAFLAPPPTPQFERLSSDSATQLALVGIRNDLAELGGNFKTGISNFASNLLQFPSNLYEGDKDGKSRRSVFEDEGFDKVPGISEDVVDFAVKISTRPGCWTDFPLSLNTDFELSEAQKAHASAIEHLVPDIVAVKNEVSSCMNTEHFWLIYFILLMPRLNGHDFELLATCKVFETRDQLLLQLQKKEAGSIKSNETPEEGSSIRETETVEGVFDKIETLKMEQREMSDGSSEERQRSFRDEEEISFSDLDMDDLSERPCSNRSTLKRPPSNASGSSDWVQLSRSQGGHSKDSEGDSSDWLPIGDSD